MNTPTANAVPNHGFFDLTGREWAVLIQIADDLTNAEIADQLCLTVKSVTNYRNCIGSKLNLQGKNNLARFARKHRDMIHKWHRLLNHK